MPDRALSFAIVIPAFNRERFIGAAIESALAQTLPADEIIVVDDGSTDRTAEIVSRYRSPVRLISISNNGAGPSRPRNVGIRAAHSRYITLLDSDDLLEETVLEHHGQVFASCPHVGLVCNNWKSAKEVDGEFRERKCNPYCHSIVGRLPKTEILPETYLISSEVAYPAYCGTNFLRTPGTTFPKALWEEVGRFDENMRTSEDYDFFLRIVSTHDIAYVTDAFAAILHHYDNISAVNLHREFVPDRYINRIRVLRKQLARNNSSEIRGEIEEHLQKIYFGLGYRYRDSKQYRSAILAFSQYRAHGGGHLSYSKAIIKLAIHRCLTLLGLL